MWMAASDRGWRTVFTVVPTICLILYMLVAQPVYPFIVNLRLNFYLIYLFI
jgi:hypothetical protein